jgi:outer membrane lipoprotein SlyB
MIMLGRWSLAVLASLVLVGTLTACDNGGVQPGVVQSPQGGYRGEAGQVVAISEVPLRNGRSGVNDGTLVGGGVGAAGGAIAGAAIGGNAGSAVLGGVLGAVGGAIAGTAIDQNATRRGIEVTVRRDDGTTVTIAQPDNGDVQMGDRVIIVYNDRGVAKAVRDTSYRRE